MIRTNSIPNIFSSILRPPKPDPLMTYRLTYEGAEPSTLATIVQAETFRLIVQHEIAVRNLPLPAPYVVAVEGLPAFDADGKPTTSGAGVFRVFRAEKMLEDGFSADKPARLQLVFPFGSEEDQDGITRWSVRMEVAGTIRNWYTIENGDRRLFDELSNR